MRRLGLIGGTSWESTAHYYAQLNEGVRRRLGGFHSADLVLRSVDFAEVEALQTAGAWAALGERYAAEAAALRAGGAEVLGILANTMHLVQEQVERGSGLPVVSIVDAVAEAAVAHGARRVGVLGTAYTMASPHLYPPRLAAHGLTALVPEPEDAAEVHRVIYDELVQGVVREASRARLSDVVARLAARGADVVVLACTELAMVLDPAGPTPVPLIDSTVVHVDALLDAALAPRAQLSEEGAA